MNEQVREHILNTFCEQNNISESLFSKGLSDMIYTISLPYYMMVEYSPNFDQNDPIGGLALTSLDRIFQTISGMFVLMAHNHFQEAEVLSRTVFESGVNLTFKFHDKPLTKYAQYFTDYIKTERSQLDKWELDLPTLTIAAIREDHTIRIQNKRDFFVGLEGFVKKFSKDYNVPESVLHKWPSLIDRMTKLNSRVGYRTIYMGMCSQTHHDAEDLLNSFLMLSIENGDASIDSSIEAVKNEKETFSLMCVLASLDWFLKAIISMMSHINLPTLVDPLEYSCAAYQKEMANLKMEEFPEHWKMP